jgi:alkylresorcinol/alkylpyrone synthase
MPVLEALGTALPGPPLAQSAIRAKAEEVLSVLAPELVEKLSVFETVGIRTRHFVQPLEWYLEPHGWADRGALHAEEGLKLLETAATDALRSAGLGPEAVDGVVLACTTGISTPSLDARLANRIGLREDVTRIPLWGLGCAGGVAGLNLAADLARAHPDRRYLLLALETCSLNFNLNDMSVRAFVATTLFSDGAAAALVRGDQLSGPRLGSLRRGLSHQWPRSEDVMGWEVVDEGLKVVFSRRIPSLVQNDLAPVVARYLKREGVAPGRHAFHPGGTKVLEAYEAALGLRPEQLAASRGVLRDFGNMSSPTVLFVLKECLKRPLAPGESALLAALGPGFSAELGLVEG